MSGQWVYKADGTLQCAQGTEISLAAMRVDLEVIVGKDAILAGEKRELPGMRPALCGTPTGQVNAYQLTDAGLYLLFHGVVGSRGFVIWHWPEERTVDKDRPVPWPWAVLRLENQNDPTDQDRSAITNLVAMLTEVRSNPTTLTEIIGRPARCYSVGDSLTMDYRPDRVNIELTSDRNINRIWFG